jgi:hypothetical protein
LGLLLYEARGTGSAVLSISFLYRKKCLLRELVNILPAGTPIVLFCLDNSSFLAANEVGKAEWFLSASVLRKTTYIFVNVYGAQESIARNRFSKPFWPVGRYDNPI